MVSAYFEGLGRWLMFNIGFRELIEKCEEYFGKGITKLGVSVIGASVVIFVVGFAFANSVYPVMTWLGAVVSGNPALTTAKTGADWIVSIVWLVVVLALVAGVLDLRRFVNQARELREDADTLYGKAHSALVDSLQLLSRIRDTMQKLPGGREKLEEALGDDIDPDVAKFLLSKGVELTPTSADGKPIKPEEPSSASPSAE